MRRAGGNRASMLRRPFLALSKRMSAETEFEKTQVRFPRPGVWFVAVWVATTLLWLVWGWQPITAPSNRRAKPNSNTLCGQRCLQRALYLLGKDAPPEEIEQQCPARPEGTSLLDLLQAAVALHLKATGIETDLRKLQILIGASVPRRNVFLAHWDEAHFVLFEDFRPDGVVVFDPAGGPAGGMSVMSQAEISGHWKGKGLLLSSESD